MLNTYSTIIASQVVYKPPTGSIGVMYEFHYQNSWNNHDMEFIILDCI